MAQELRYGFMGKVNVAIIEACEVTPDGKIYLTAAGGIAPTICRLADQIIIELNAAHSKNAMGLHDVYEPLDPPYRRDIPIYKPSDRIGLPYVQVDPKKIVGIVETNWPDEARSFADADPLTDKIGQNVADFLAADMKRGIIPPSFLPLQSGVGNIANAVLGALGRDKTIPPFEMYTEVIQNSVIGLIREGRIKFGSACSLTVTNDCLNGIYEDMDFFRDKLVLRPCGNLQQPGSGTPTGYHLYQYRYRGRPLRQRKLYTHRRYQDDERHRWFCLFYPQCLYLYLYLSVGGQGRQNQCHCADGITPRPHRTRCEHHHYRTGCGRPARQEPEGTCTDHHRKLCTPRLQEHPVGLPETDRRQGFDPARRARCPGHARRTGQERRHEECGLGAI